jgi:hypothetical protein
MPALPQADRDTYAGKGFLHPVRVMSPAEALDLRKAVEGSRPHIPRAQGVMR